MTARKVGRNDPCPCGSGRKYKSCHGKQGESRSKLGAYAIAAVIIAIAGVIVYTFTTEGTSSRQVWDPVHGHYHTIP